MPQTNPIAVVSHARFAVLSGMRLTTIALAALVMTVACVAPESVSTEEGLTGGNGIHYNGIHYNGLGMGGVVEASLSTSEEALHAIRSNPLMGGVLESKLIRMILDDAGSQELLTYLLECGLAPGDKVQLESADLSFQETVQGAFGFAPEWRSQPCDVECQRRVSSCLFMRINQHKERVMISARVAPNGRTFPGLYAIPKQEALAYPHIEASFFGNYFNWVPRVGHPEMYVCGAGPDPRLGELKLRVCGDMPDPLGFCEDIVIGACGTEKKCPLEKTDEDGKVCVGPLDKNGAATACADTNDLCSAGTNAVFYEEVATVYRSEACEHLDYEPGIALNPACSPCANAMETIDPSCVTDEWDLGCVKLAAQKCAEHSIDDPGPPLTRGTLDAVTAVCETKPDCCDDFWTTSCAQAALAFYP